MRIPTLLAVTLIGWSQFVAAGETHGDVEAGANKATACAACHNAMISLKDRGVETIIEQSKAIQSGEKQHPTGLAGLNEQDLADIAAYLDAAE